MEKDYKEMFNILDEYLKNRVEDIDTTILEAVEARKNGKIFSFEEHLKAFIYAQLSALVSWKKIKDNSKALDDIFCNFSKDKLKKKPAEDLINEITALKCHNPFTTKKQMYSLVDNICTFEKLEKKFLSLDNFILQDAPSNIVRLLADRNSEYKLKQAGIALVCEYLRNVGIDIVKPDVHIKRIVATDRLNLTSAKSEYKIIEELKNLSDETGISQVKIDYLLWNFCAKKYGEICTATPKCNECVIREYCQK